MHCTHTVPCNSTALRRLKSKIYPALRSIPDSAEYVPASAGTYSPVYDLTALARINHSYWSSIP